MNENQLTPLPPEPPAVLMRQPDAALGIAEILAQVRLIQEVMREVMHDGEHYGTIPGCGDKKTLLQPGAQKICMTFRLAPEYTLQESALGDGHKEYRVICRLSSIASGTFVGSGVGVCSTMEGKYRFRGGARKCPTCGKETIIKGKAEYGGGWLCFAKKGGCGAKWADGAAVIEGQNIERVEHDNPADHFNTVLKMAKKRAFVDATITATAASDIFTQDISDPEGETTAQDAPPASPAPVSRAASPVPVQSPPQTLSALLEASKTKLLNQPRAVNTAMFRHFVMSGIIQDTEDLGDVPMAALFPSVDMKESAADNSARIKADFDKLMAAIQSNMDGDDQIPGAEAPTDGHGSPASAPAAVNWKTAVLPFDAKTNLLAKKGMTLGALFANPATSKYAFGICMNFKAEPYQGTDGTMRDPSPESVAFAAGCAAWRAEHGRN